VKRANLTYGQLDKMLRALGFTCRPTRNKPPGRRYEHTKTGAVVLVPDYPESDKVFEYHMVAVRAELDHFGIADPTMFDEQLQKPS
jgi:hypothetical protein